MNRTQKRVLTVVRQYMKISAAIPPAKVIGKELGLSADAVNKAIIVLEELNHLEVDRSRGTVNRRFYFPKRRAKLPTKPAPEEYTERHCMTCGKSFPSEGPHNRMCNPCRIHADEVRDYRVAR